METCPENAYNIYAPHRDFKRGGPAARKKVVFILRRYGPGGSYRSGTCRSGHSSDCLQIARGGGILWRGGFGTFHAAQDATDPTCVTAMLIGALFGFGAAFCNAVGYFFGTDFLRRYNSPLRLLLASNIGMPKPSQIDGMTNSLAC